MKMKIEIPEGAVVRGYIAETSVDEEGLKRAFFPAPRGDRMGQKTPFTIKLGGDDEGTDFGQPLRMVQPYYRLGAEVEGFATLEINLLLIQERGGRSYAFGGNAKLVAGYGKVYEVAQAFFDHNHGIERANGFLALGGERPRCYGQVKLGGPPIEIIQ